MTPNFRLIDLFDTPPARKASSRSNSRMKRGFASHKDGFWVIAESYLEFRFAVEQDIDWRVRRMKSQPERRRSEEHTSELQSLMRISYAVFCLKKKHKKH